MRMPFNNSNVKIDILCETVTELIGFFFKYFFYRLTKRGALKQKFYLGLFEFFFHIV